MKLGKVKVKAKRVAHSTKFFLKSHKNDILFGAGVVTEVAAVVTAARAGAKQHDMHEMYARQLDNLVDADTDCEEMRQVNAEGRRRVYRGIVKGTVKNYALPVCLTAASVGLLSKSHFDLKHDLTTTTAALAAEHALNQKLLEAQGNIPKEPEEGQETTEEAAAPYSGGIPNDLDKMFLSNAVIVYDSESKYFAEREGYSQPTTVMLSPTSIKWEKAELSDWTANFDWNVSQIMRVMGDVIGKAVTLYGFVNLNEIRKHFSSSRSYKLEEAENYYIVFNENRHEDDQVVYRIYGECDADGAIMYDHLYIDIFNSIVPRPGQLKEAKQRAVAANPLKDI
ncbi:MAG: hypothetical protein J6U54_17710 [Clostridiales bacterium]|nr:hypothetical protein [Clostridiales bacterium]